MVTSGFLSEVYAEKALKISGMKVGSSPLYFVPGQEALLENFFSYLPQKEKEAVLLLKEKKLLKDTEQEPAIRVALRALKDFAFPLTLKTGEIQTTFWYYLTLSEQEAKSRIEELVTSAIAPLKITVKEPEIKQITPQTEIQPITQKTKEKVIKEKRITKKPKIVEAPKSLIEIKPTIQPKQEKPKEKSEFVNKIIAFLQKQDIELLQELSYKKKEFSSIVRINTDLGKLSLLCIAKDKKNITENDLKLALQNSQVQKMPSLIISQAELNSKAQAYLDEHKNLIKIIKL